MPAPKDGDSKPETLAELIKQQLYDEGGLKLEFEKLVGQTWMLERYETNDGDYGPYSILYITTDREPGIEYFVTTGGKTVGSKLQFIADHLALPLKITFKVNGRMHDIG